MENLLKLFGFLLMLQTVYANVECSPRCGERYECPSGTLAFGGVQGCFKTNKEKVTWFQAKQECERDNLQMVQPKSNNDAIKLRRALLENFGHGTFWLGAQANNYNYVWNNYGGSLSNDDSLWYPGLPGEKITTNHCLTISVNHTNFVRYPNQPYGEGPCNHQWYSTICEVAITPTPVQLRTVCSSVASTVVPSFGG